MAYRPAKEFIDGEVVKNHKDLTRVLKQHSWIRRDRPRGKNGSKVPNRLQIHAGDWHKMLAEQKTAGTEPLDMQAGVIDAVREIEKRKAEKLARKQHQRK